MALFFELESGYLAIALFALLVTIFVTTRPFVAKGAWKKGVSFVMITIVGFIGAHYFVTVDRMNDVETAFKNNKKVICESRMLRKVAQSVTIEKSNEWSLDNHIFSSPNYSRGFFSARCIEYVPVTLN